MRPKEIRSGKKNVLVQAGENRSHNLFGLLFFFFAGYLAFCSPTTVYTEGFKSPDRQVSLRDFLLNSKMDGYPLLTIAVFSSTNGAMPHYFAVFMCSVCGWHPGFYQCQGQV